MKLYLYGYLQQIRSSSYSNGEQAETCEARGILPHVPAQHAINNVRPDKPISSRVTILMTSRPISIR